MRVRRTLGVILLGTVATAAGASHVVTSDAFVKRMVRSLLAQTLRGPATVESASFSFLRGLEVRELDVRDPTDPLGDPALAVERLSADYRLGGPGGAAITAVVLDRPRVRIRREADGALSLAKILAPPDQDTSTPVPPPLRVTEGTLAFDDEAILRGGPVVARHVHGALTPADDGTWSLHAEGVCDELGPLVADVRVGPGGRYEIRASFPDVRLSKDLVERLNLPAADAALAWTPRGRITLSVVVVGEPGQPIRRDADLGMREVDLTVPVPGAQTLPVRIAQGRVLLRGDDVVLEDLRCAAAGAYLEAKGTAKGLLDEGGPELDVQLGLEGLRVGPALDPHLPPGVRLVTDAYRIQGRVDATATLRGRTSAIRPSVLAKVHDGSLCYEGYEDEHGVRHGFAWPVSAVEGEVAFDGRVLAIAATARRGNARVQARGTIDYAAGDEVPEIEITATDVPLDDAIKAAFQSRGEAMWERWGPGGTAARIDVRVLRDAHTDGTHGSATEVVCSFDGRARFRPDVFPAPLEGVTGRVEILAPGGFDARRELVRLRAVSARAPGMALTVDGTVRTAGHVTDEEIRVTGSVEDLAGPFRDALLDPRSRVPPGVKDVYRDLGPAGATDFSARLSSDGERRHDHVELRLRGASVRSLRALPVGLSELRGPLVIDGDEAAFPGLSGRLLDTTFEAEGRLLGLSGDVALDARVRVPHLPLGEPLRRALGDLASGASALWDGLRPVGGDGVEGTRADASLVFRPPGTGPVVEARLTNVRGPLLPLGLEFDCAGGTVHWDGATARVTGLEAAVGGAGITVAEALYDARTGDLTARATLRGLRFPEDLEPVLGEETTAKIEDVLPWRNLHAEDVLLRWSAAERAFTWTGPLSVRPRSRRVVPDPGFAPEGTLSVEPFVLRMPAPGSGGATGAAVTIDATVTTEDFRLRAGVPVEELRGTIRVAGSSGDDGFSLAATTEDASFRVAGYPFEKAKLTVETRPRGVRADLVAEFCGGAFTALVRPGGDRVAYRGEMHLSRASLARIAAGRGDVKGDVTGHVWFENATGAAPDLRGTCEVNVADGDLGRFPVLTAILNLWPGAGNLTEGTLQGELAGKVVTVKGLDIRGPILSLSKGRGRFDLDGNLDILLNPSLPLWIGAILPVHVGGTLRNPDAALRPLGTAPGPEKPSVPAPQPGGDLGDDERPR